MEYDTLRLVPIDRRDGGDNLNASSRWPLTNIEQEKLIHNLTINMPLLRAKLDISQDEISKIIGVSRQTYSAIESGKRRMSWQVYLSLVLFFDANKMTRDLLHHLECFPDLLVDRTTITEDEPHQNPADIDADILQMLTKLDDQALRSVKTVLMVEYARCSKIPGEAVVKAFDGSQFTGSLTTRDVELANAIQQVKMRMNTNES